MRRFTCDTSDWHVFARGARRLQLFRDDQDFSRFLIFLRYALKRSACTLWAFALMTNHYHLVLRGSSAELTSCMRRLNSMYSRYHNRRYGLDGHTFDGPYQAFRQPTDILMLHTIAYVHYNPVKGGLCANPEDYPWSSAKCFVERSSGQSIVDPTSLFKSMGPDPRQAWARFHQAMSQEARRPAKPTVGRPTMIELHQRQFEWLLEHARRIPDRLGSEDPTIVAMYWARQVGVTPKAIAQVLGLESTASIRDALYRFGRRLEKDPDLRARMELQ